MKRTAKSSAGENKDAKSGRVIGFLSSSYSSSGGLSSSYSECGGLSSSYSECGGLSSSGTPSAIVQNGEVGDYDSDGEECTKGGPKPVPVTEEAVFGIMPDGTLVDMPAKRGVPHSTATNMDSKVADAEDGKDGDSPSKSKTVSVLDGVKSVFDLVPDEISIFDVPTEEELTNTQMDSLERKKDSSKDDSDENKDKDQVPVSSEAMEPLVLSEEDDGDGDDDGVCTQKEAKADKFQPLPAVPSIRPDPYLGRAGPSYYQFKDPRPVQEIGGGDKHDLPFDERMRRKWLYADAFEKARHILIREVQRISSRAAATGSKEPWRLETASDEDRWYLTMAYSSAHGKAVRVYLKESLRLMHLQQPLEDFRIINYKDTLDLCHMACNGARRTVLEEMTLDNCLKDLGTIIAKEDAGEAVADAKGKTDDDGSGDGKGDEKRSNSSGAGTGDKKQSNKDSVRDGELKLQTGHEGKETRQRLPSRATGKSSETLSGTDGSDDTGEMQCVPCLQFLERMKEYKYAIAQFADEIVPIPTTWFRLDSRGWEAKYPFEVRNAQRYVDFIHNLHPRRLLSIPFRWYPIARPPTIPECANYLRDLAGKVHRMRDMVRRNEPVTDDEFEREDGKRIRLSPKAFVAECRRSNQLVKPSAKSDDKANKAPVGSVGGDGVLATPTGLLASPSAPYGGEGCPAHATSPGLMASPSTPYGGGSCKGKKA